MKEDTQTTTSKQQTDPWKPAIPLLRDLLRQYGSFDPSVTGDQNMAMRHLTGAAARLPNFGRDANQVVRGALDFDTQPQIGMLSDAYADLRKNIGGTASGSELDPRNTPGFADAINAMTGDITSKVKGSYAAAGRDPSGAGSFAGSLGQGLTEGIAPILMEQYNRNKTNQMGAASTLYGAGASTASGTAALKELASKMGMLGIGAIPGATAAALNPAMTQLNVANQRYSQPLDNLAKLLQPAVALGSMGQQGQSTSTQSTPQSTMGNILGGAMGGTGILSQMGAFGSSGWLTPFLSSAGSSAASMFPMLAMSDERTKDEVEEIGELKDGQKVVRFRYKNDPEMRMGLLAQDVEKFVPSAVHDVGGLKAVDYRRATDRAANLKRAA